MSDRCCSVFVVRALAVVALLGATVALPAKKQAYKLPDDHVTCYRDDPKFNDCFKTSLQVLLRAFHAEGVPALGVRPLDPLTVPLVRVEYTQGDDLVSNVNVTGLVARGVGKLKITSVRSNFSTGDAFWMRIKGFLPRFQNDGQYVVDGMFQELPIRGSGGYNLTSGGLKGTFKLQGRHYSKNGVDHVRLEHVDYRPSIKTLHFHADDLFTGNKQLSEAALAAINIFWPIFYEATLPGFSQAWGGLLTNWAAPLFQNVPFDTLFPLSPAAQQAAPARAS